MAKFYVVEVPEIHTSRMVVRASSAEEAAQFVADGEGTELSTQYSNTLDTDSRYEVGEWETYVAEYQGVPKECVGASVIYNGTNSDGGTWLLVHVKKGVALLHRTVNGAEETRQVPSALVCVDSPSTTNSRADVREILARKESSKYSS